MEQFHHHHNHQVELQAPPQYFTTASVTTTDVNPTPVANATPTQPQLASNHPSYAEMITAAILWDSSQGKAGGSSKRAIAKYIDRVYSNLPPTHSALLTHHLKRLKNMGQLVMIKNSYQLPVVAAAAGAGAAGSVPIRSVTNQVQDTESTPKKRPGRPPKPKPEHETQPGSTTNGHSLSGGKRPRGRPPRVQKPVVAEVPFVQAQPEAQVQPNYGSDMGLGLINNVSPLSSVKRRPGRPPKNQAQNQAQYQAQIVPVNGTVSQKKRPGRPPKAKVENGIGQVSSNVVGQVSSSGGPKRRGRPKRNVLGPVSPPIGKKSRGRPPRQPGVVASTPGKRRGRPPKGSVLPLPKAAMRKLYSGKPRGRPKKSASTPGKATPAVELIQKVENMQAKIKDAVDTLKPYFPIENATNEALAALQQLEDISIMDITAPPSQNPPVEPPVTTIPMNNEVIPSAPSEIVIAPAPSVPTIPAPQAAAPPPVLPFNMTGSAPFYMPQNVGTQQPTSWIPSGEAQL